MTNWIKIIKKKIFKQEKQKTKGQLIHLYVDFYEHSKNCRCGCCMYEYECQQQGNQYGAICHNKYYYFFFSFVDGTINKVI